MSRQCAAGHVFNDSEEVCNRCGGVDIAESEVITPAEEVKTETEVAPVEAESTEQTETVEAPVEEVKTQGEFDATAADTTTAPVQTEQVEEAPVEAQAAQVSAAPADEQAAI